MCQKPKVKKYNSFAKTNIMLYFAQTIDDRTGHLPVNWAKYHNEAIESSLHMKIIQLGKGSVRNI